MTKLQFDDLWSALNLPALVVDGQGVLTNINPAAESFFNATQKTMGQRVIWQEIATSAALKDAVAGVLASKTPYIIHETDISRIDCPVRICQLHLSPMQIGHDPAVLIVFHPQDSTSNIIEYAPQLSAVKSAVGLSAMLAHEIKNPLAGIIGAAQLLSMDDTENKSELTDLIVQECKRINVLLNDMEQFGDMRDPHYQAVNIHDVLNRAQKSAEIGFAKHMQFIQDFDPSLPATAGDMGQLVQVVLNLLKNAAEAQPKHGIITLRTFFKHGLRKLKADGDMLPLPLQLEICDNGAGIPHDIAKNLFDPFVTTHENGRGLGLALVSKIITQHKGRISVDRAQGQTVFRISLPIHHDQTGKL